MCSSSLSFEMFPQNEKFRLTRMHSRRMLTVRGGVCSERVSAPGGLGLQSALGGSARHPLPHCEQNGCQTGVTRMHSSRIRTIRNSRHLLFWGAGTSWSRHACRADPPGSRHPPPAAGTSPWEQAAPWEMHHPQEQTPAAARHAGIPPAMHAGIASTPHGQNDRHV